MFPTAGHLASWAGRCPSNNITGGKRRSGKPTKGNRWLADVLTECAWTAAEAATPRLAAQFWRLARRIGKKKAAVAVGHSILVICWYLLDGGYDYHDLGGDFFIRRDGDRARQRAVAQLQALGYEVTPPTRRLTPRGFSFQEAMHQGCVRWRQRRRGGGGGVVADIAKLSVGREEVLHPGAGH